MDIRIPKIVKPLVLAEYDAGMDGALQVWVNPPRALLAQYYDLLNQVAEARQAKDEAKLTQLADRVAVWASEIWSQGEPETRLSVDEVKAVAASTADTDPAFWVWLTGKTLRMILDHRNTAKKA